MATTSTIERNIGQSIPRLEAREKVTGRAEYVHHLRLPGMLYGKIFRSTVPHGAHQERSTSAPRRRSPASTASSRSRTFAASFRIPITARPFTISRCSPTARCASPASRSPSCSLPIRHIAEEAAGLIIAEYEELPAVLDEVEAMTSDVLVHDELKPGGDFPDLKHLKGRKGTNVALDYHLRRGDVEAAFAARRSCVRAHVPHPAGDAHADGAVRHRGGCRRRAC